MNDTTNIVPVGDVMTLEGLQKAMDTLKVAQKEDWEDRIVNRYVKCGAAGYQYLLANTRAVDTQYNEKDKLVSLTFLGIPVFIHKDWPSGLITMMGKTARGEDLVLQHFKVT